MPWILSSPYLPSGFQVVLQNCWNIIHPLYEVIPDVFRLLLTLHSDLQWLFYLGACQPSAHWILIIFTCLFHDQTVTSGTTWSSWKLVVLANMHTKRFSASLLEKCRSKLQGDVPSHQSARPSSKKSTKDKFQRENGHLCSVGGNVNWYSHYEEQCGGSLKPKTGSAMLLSFSCSVVSESATPWTATHQTFLSFTIFQSLLKLMSIEPVMRSNRLILCHPLLLLPSSFPRIKVFSSESSALRIRWPKYWSFSFNVSPSNEYSGLISFRIEWFDLLAVQGSLKSLFQHHSWKTSVLRCSAFFIHHMSQQSHSWAWVRKRQRPYFKKIHAPQCSLQHYLK